MCPPLECLLSQLNSVYIITLRFVQIDFNKTILYQINLISTLCFERMMTQAGLWECLKEM
jgi:hypothetical protein